MINLTLIVSCERFSFCVLVTEDKLYKATQENLDTTFKKIKRGMFLLVITIEYVAF